MDFTTKCSLCNGIEAKTKPILTPQEIEHLMERIYLGKINSKTLPMEIYIKVAKQLEVNLYKGFGTDINHNTTPSQLSKLKPMRDNCYHFAAAKTYQMIRQAEVERTSETGMVSKEMFLKNAQPIVEKFMGVYQFAESDHAKSAGKSAKNWLKIESKENPPYLEYLTMKDNRVRPAHVYLDGIIRISTDKFWNTFNPPNGWLCRCKTKSWAKGENTNLESFDKEEMLKGIPKEFRVNFGKEAIVFTKDHPYFKVPKADKYEAKQNFKLPLPHEH